MGGKHSIRPEQIKKEDTPIKASNPCSDRGIFVRYRRDLNPRML